MNTAATVLPTPHKAMPAHDADNNSPDPAGTGAPVGLDSHSGPAYESSAHEPSAHEPSDHEPSDHASPAAEHRGGKFVYASGSGPLEGYTIKRGVGSGGFGEVYFATSDAGKEVALKLIRRNLDVELRGVKQCLNLKHPNLVALYDLKKDGSGDQWVVMEYVPLGAGGGMTLEEAIEAHPSGMPERDVLAWMRGIAAGVGYLHSSGVVHRDLKPGNIFRDITTSTTGAEDLRNEVKIGDYGLSKFISCSRRSGQTESVGTVHYMAPEIANGRYGREVDLYALGIILYELLTGHVPFEGESIGEVLMKHLTAEPDLSVLKRPYRDVVRRLLAKDPAERISSVGELIAELPSERTVAGPTYDGSGQFPVYDPVGDPVDDPVDEIPLTLAEDFPASQPAPPNAAGPNAARAEQPYAAGGANAANMAAAPVADPRYGEEPLWRGIKDLFSGATDWWAHGSAPPLVRGLVLFGAVMLLMTTGIFGTLLGVLPMLLVVYLVYYVVWSIFAPSPPPRQPTRQPPRPRQATAQRSTEPPPQHPAAAKLKSSPRGHAQQARRLRQTWRETAKKQILAKSFRQNVQELLGSMLTSAGLCFILAGLVSMFATERFGYPTAPLMTWLTIATTLGCWAVLLTNKFTEGRVEDRIPMRGMLLVGGVLVGLLMGVVSVGAPVFLPNDHHFSPGWHNTLSPRVLDFPTSHQFDRKESSFTVAPLAAMGYFAMMFALVRWWRLAEYTRDKRLSLWSVAACVFAAWLLHFFWWFPQPTGMLVAGIVAVATQLASPWLPPSKREAMARGEVV